MRNTVGLYARPQEVITAIRRMRSQYPPLRGLTARTVVSHHELIDTGGARASLSMTIVTMWVLGVRVMRRERIECVLHS